MKSQASEALNPKSLQSQNRLRQKFESPIKPLEVLHGRLGMVLAAPQGLPMNFTRGSLPFVFDSSPWWRDRFRRFEGGSTGDRYGEGLRSVFKTEVVLSIKDCWYRKSISSPIGVANDLAWRSQRARNIARRLRIS